MYLYRSLIITFPWGQTVGRALTYSNNLLRRLKGRLNERNHTVSACIFECRAQLKFQLGAIKNASDLSNEFYFQPAVAQPPPAK